MQEIKLYVVFDVSGSMQEMAKMSLAQDLFYFIVEFARLWPEKTAFNVIKPLFWSESIQEYNYQSGEALNLPAPGGRADFSVLSDFFAAIKEEFHVILLSDGCFEAEKGLQLSSAVCVGLGMDADFSTLSKISRKGKSFAAENIHAAVESLAVFNGGFAVKSLFEEEDEEGWE